MDKPTRGQWRAYFVLMTLLLALLALLIFRPFADGTPQPLDSSLLQQQIEQHGQQMADSAESRRQAWRQRQRKYRRGDRRTYHYDTARRHYDRHEYTRPPIPTIELNSADTAELKLLPGIGSVFARRIVKFRALLGGFACKEQLLEVYGMDRERYEGIAQHIVVDTSALLKIDINSATLQELKKHPYLDYYQARAIVDYRKRVGLLRDREDLMKINLLDDSSINKIVPYIKYNK